MLSCCNHSLPLHHRVRTADKPTPPILALLCVFIYICLTSFPHLNALVTDCVFSTHDGMRFDDLVLLKREDSDYAANVTVLPFSSSHPSSVSGNNNTTNSTSTFLIQLNVCRVSASNNECAFLFGSICITNTTTALPQQQEKQWEQEERRRIENGNVSAATLQPPSTSQSSQSSLSSSSSTPHSDLPLIIGGRYDISPVPYFELISTDDPQNGVKMSYHNGLPYENPLDATLYLHCILSTQQTPNGDPIIPPTTISQVVYSPQENHFEFHIVSPHACITHVPPPPFHLTAVEIFLIVFFSFLTFYFIGGCAYKTLIKGIPIGVESIPHINGIRQAPVKCAACCHFSYSYLRNGCKRDSEVYTEL